MKQKPFKYVAMVFLQRGGLRFCYFTSRAHAESQCSLSRSQAPRFGWRVVVYDILPNQRIRAYGVQKFEKILMGIGDVGLELVGTRAELIACGVADDYMFEQLGEQGQRSGPTEYGDKFRLQRLGKDRFELRVYLNEVAENPYGMSKIDPYDTDISDIMARVQAGGAS